MGTETKIPKDIAAAFLLPGEDYSPLLCRQALHSILLTELVNIPVLRMLFVHLFQTRPFSLLYHLSTQPKAAFILTGLLQDTMSRTGLSSIQQRKITWGLQTKAT